MWVQPERPVVTAVQSTVEDEVDAGNVGDRIPVYPPFDQFVEMFPNPIGR